MADMSEMVKDVILVENQKKKNLFLGECAQGSKICRGKINECFTPPI